LFDFGHPVAFLCLMTPLADFYTTITSMSTGEYKEKSSKFLAFAYPFDQEDSLQEILGPLRSTHIKARHFCYAYRIGVVGTRFRANDDGEPSGTAGKPILSQILSFELTNVIIVVVRYFGGTKLGASGLANAYKEAAREALAGAETTIKYISDELVMRFGYDQMGHVMSVIKEVPEAFIIHKNFDAGCTVHLSIRKSRSREILLNLKAGILQVSVEQASAVETIPGVEIEMRDG